jgi:hypothetical protein
MHDEDQSQIIDLYDGGRGCGLEELAGPVQKLRTMRPPRFSRDT